MTRIDLGDGRTMVADGNGEFTGKSLNERAMKVAKTLAGFRGQIFGDVVVIANEYLEK